MASTLTNAGVSNVLTQLQSQSKYKMNMFVG